MSRTQPSSEWVHLFTSTIRELYISDAVDLVAAPHGAHFQFRYESKYVADALKKRWSENDLIGIHVATYFSIMHPADFHIAMYLPLRTGKVVSTRVEGSSFVVTFSLASYLALGDHSIPDSQEPLAARVRDFTEEVKLALPDGFPDISVHANVGPPPPSSARSSGSDGQDFETLVRYLTPALHFSPRVYFRAADIEDEVASKSVRIDGSGSVRLTAGRTYVMRIAHFQVQMPTDEVELLVKVPEGLQLLSNDILALRSRYDLFVIRFFAKYRDDETAGELVVSTSPVRGPEIRIPIIVQPSVGHSISGPVLGIGGATAVLLPPILGSPAENLALRIILALVGGGLAGLGLWLRRRRGLPG